MYVLFDKKCQNFVSNKTILSVLKVFFMEDSTATIFVLLQPVDLV